MYVEAIAYLISTRTPLQGFFPLSTSQFYIWERGKGIVRVQYPFHEHKWVIPARGQNWTS